MHVAPSNEVILLGNGMQTEADGTVHLSQLGYERADRFLQYYGDNEMLFRSPRARVICSGGYGLLAAGIDRPDNPLEREGIITADYLVAEGVPARIIDVEADSTSTLKNLTNSIALNYIQPTVYNPERRLGIVSHPNHIERAVFVAGKLGIREEVIQRIPTDEQDSRRQELMLRCLYRAVLLGAHGSAELIEREDKLGAFLGKVRRG